MQSWCRGLFSLDCLKTLSCWCGARHFIPATFSPTFNFAGNGYRARTACHRQNQSNFREKRRRWVFHSSRNFLKIIIERRRVVREEAHARSLHLYVCVCDVQTHSRDFQSIGRREEHIERGAGTRRAAAAAAYLILKVYDRCRMPWNVKIDSASEWAGSLSVYAAARAASPAMN